MYLSDSFSNNIIMIDISLYYKYWPELKLVWTQNYFILFSLTVLLFAVHRQHVYEWAHGSGVRMGDSQVPVEVSGKV